MPVPGSPEWRARIASLIAQEATQPLVWWYLSFAVPGEFRGAVILRARGFASAHAMTHMLKINPGGEVAGTEIGPELPPGVTESMTGRLLTKAEMAHHLNARIQEETDR